MLELFQHSFMVRALIAGALVGVICPALGTFLVLRRLALIADTLAHVALAGVAVGLVTGTSPFIFAIIASTLAAGAIEWLRSTGRVLGDVALALFLYAALAVAIVLISLDHGLNANLFSFLFGSILTVTTTDLWLIGGLAVVVLLTVLVFYPELLQTTFDQELATVSGLRVRWVNLLLAVLTGVTVALAMRIVGVLLVGALMVIPVIASLQISRGFRTTVVVAVVLGLIAVIIGLVAAYYLSLAAGGAIVLAALVVLLWAVVVRGVLRWRAQHAA